jgi:purine-binding chemotaxis protein CheW
MDEERLYRCALVCRTGGRLCALPLIHVLETLRPLPLEALGEPRPPVLGLARIRGASLPVVDLAALLNLPAQTPGRFVTLAVGRRRAALAVGEVLGIRELPAAAAEPLPPLLAEPELACIKALARLDQELLLVLHGARLLPSEAGVPA